MWQVTVSTAGTALTDGSVYASGATPVLTDAQYAALTAGMFANISAVTRLSADQVPAVPVQTVQPSAQPAASSAVTVTAAAITSLASTGIPPGVAAAGAKWRITAHGQLGTASTAPTYICDLRWGGTGGTLIMNVRSTATANAPALAVSLTAAPVIIEAEIEFITSTTCVGWLRLQWLNNTTTPGTASNWVSVFASITSAVTVTTSSAESLSLNWTWSATGTGTTITIASSSVQRIS